MTLQFPLNLAKWKLPFDKRLGIDNWIKSKPKWGKYNKSTSPSKMSSKLISPRSPMMPKTGPINFLSSTNSPPAMKQIHTNSDKFSIWHQGFLLWELWDSSISHYWRLIVKISERWLMLMYGSFCTTSCRIQQKILYHPKICLQTVRVYHFLHHHWI